MVFENANSPTRREQFMLYAPLLIWIGVILFLGSSEGSMTRTSLIIRPLLEFLFPNAPEETLQFYHGIIRKFAHFAEYGVLALLAARVFVRNSSRHVSRHFFAASFLLVLLIAAIDEYKQSFDPTRTSSSVDVLIDLSGGIASLFAVASVMVVRKIRRRPKPSEELRENL